jgi:CDP-paratose 2-epimerase
MSRNFLVTGGAGFIGSNYVDRLLGRGEEVIVYDNLSRAGARLNLEWLQGRWGQNAFRLVLGDVRDAARLAQVTREVDVVVHLASQVAVTTSVLQPRADFESNALGTFNVLEAARLSGRQPAVLYASTNKVYGGIKGVAIEEQGSRYAYARLLQGISETQPLDFHSPYGCSKGSGDQYTRDYHRIYGLPTVVLRQSCIYGPRQFGVEDQGWVAWFIIAVAKRRQIKIFGDGKQVRDLLYISDLLDAYDLALEKITETAGQVYNLGGGPEASISIWQEFGPLLERIFNREISVEWGNWRRVTRRSMCPTSARRKGPGLGSAGGG